jgi:positive phototaxis protein PixI
MVDPTMNPNAGTLAIAAASPPPPASPPSEEEQFLRLLLIPDTTLALSVQYLLEVLTFPMNQVVSLPHLPPWVMGVHNWRGEILWMVDLGHLLGLPPWYQQPVNRSEFSAIVVHHKNGGHSRGDRLLLGLVVHEVDDIEWCNPRDIKPLPPTVIIPEMAPFVQGCCWKPDGGMLTIIDGKAIFQAMPKSSSLST